VDNRTIAQTLGEIADLLELKGENAFKIRAYRNAADVVGTSADPIARLDEAGLRTLPGIGKDLAARIREFATTGVSTYHQALLAEFPATVLDLLRLQGIGPKTVALLFSSLGIGSVEELATAARSGRLRSVKGMGAKKEALILKAIEERAKDSGRHLLSQTAAMADDIVTSLSSSAPATTFVPVGSLRRGTETCGDIDILAVEDDPATGATIMAAFVEHPRVERVLGHGDTKSSVRLLGGFQADLRLVPHASQGAAMQYFTGSKAHNIALRDRALQRGFRLNEYGLFRLADEAQVAGETEADIYAALGLPWIDPALREQRGELEAADAGSLPPLVALDQLRGDLHAHTTESDGRDTLEVMAAAAHRLGYEYLAITDHSKALAMANGLDEHRALAHAARVRALNGRFDGLTLLAGIECDILPDGSLDLAHDCLAELDVVVASVHSQFSQEEARMTARVLSALDCPWVDILGHATGRRLLRRDPVKIDLDQVAAAAARHGIAIEINSQPHRLDLNDAHARLARARGVRIVVSSDAHATTELQNLRWGVQVARRAWLTPSDVLNTHTLDALRASLRRNRTPWPRHQTASSR
jgi:DNA polymerase (family 10)